MSTFGMTTGKRPKKSPPPMKSSKGAGKKKNATPEILLAPPAIDAVTSLETGAGIQPSAAPASPARSNAVAQITLVRSNAPRKDKRIVIYNIEGRAGSVQFLSTLFGGSQDDQGNPPERMTLDGEFAEPKVAKAKETPEERKARLAALPKPTLEQQVAKAEERARKLREKLSKGAEPVAAGM